MIVKGAVLIPNIPDKVWDVLDEETIRKVSLIFNRQVNLSTYNIPCRQLDPYLNPTYVMRKLLF